MSLTTAQFCNQYVEKQYELLKGEKEPSMYQKVISWAQENPTLVKITEISGMILGVVAVAALPLTYPIAGVAALLATGVLGCVGIISFVAYKALDLAVSPHHNMKNHVFHTGSYGVGRLYYQRDVPILELNSNDPYEAGIAHGYLMAEPLSFLLEKLTIAKRFTDFIQMPHNVEALNLIREQIPHHYLTEMEGIVEGFNRWNRHHQKQPLFKLTLDYLLVLHLMPDSTHFDINSIGDEKPAAIRNPLSSDATPVLGCTVVIDQDKEEGLTFGRIMDWESFGYFGSHSLVINRKYTNGKASTAEVGFPGFVGTITGMNKHGLSLSMNVCSGSTNSIQGMPAVFFNRLCLEDSQDVEHVNQIIQQQAPLGGYHLSAADSESAKAFHLYQNREDENEPHVIREFNPRRAPLIVTNCNYKSNGSRTNPMHCSYERENHIRKLFKKAQSHFPKPALKRSDVVEYSLKLPFVNNSLSTHKVMMFPQSKKMKVAFNNHFAGKSLLQEVDTKGLFDS